MVRRPVRAMPGALSLAEARRIALAAQGFHLPRPRRPATRRQLRDALLRIGALQIDFVNVLVPAHYLIPFSRVGPYERRMLDDLVYRRREFTEQAAHEAAIVPVQQWPLLRRRIDGTDRRARALARFMEQYGEYAAEVLDAVRAQGPLAVEHAPPPAAQHAVRRDAWGWTLQRAALEGQFHSGALAVAERRSDYARMYDLAERVIPATHHSRSVSEEEATRELLRLAARALGVGTADDLADYYRLPIRAARRHLRDLAAAGEVQETRVEGWRDAAYLHPRAERPKRISARALLSPFDPLVWYRPRAARLFGFDYRIEIYVPKEKRRWGYYVLPFLLGDTIVARVDLKADRGERRLLVLAAYAEPVARGVDVAGPLAAELRLLVEWLGLDVIDVARKGNLARALRAAAS